MPYYNGGTEANLMAMRAARNLTKIDDPEIIVPRSANSPLKKLQRCYVLI
jgi:tyrosine decarboxylase/aspartate 1-decarboxylase